MGGSGLTSRRQHNSSPTQSLVSPAWHPLCRMCDLWQQCRGGRPHDPCMPHDATRRVGCTHRDHAYHAPIAFERDLGFASAATSSRHCWPELVVAQGFHVVLAWPALHGGCCRGATGEWHWTRDLGFASATAGPSWWWPRAFMWYWHGLQHMAGAAGAPRGVSLDASDRFGAALTSA
jgi:hypothetical protein